MPISIQAPRGEGSEARAEARRSQARSKRRGSLAFVRDRDMVPSRVKARAASMAAQESKRPCVKMLEDTVAEALVVPEEMRGRDFAQQFNIGLAN